MNGLNIQLRLYAAFYAKSFIRNKASNLGLQLISNPLIKVPKPQIETIFSVSKYRGAYV